MSSNLDVHFNVRFKNIHNEIINHFKETNNIRDRSKALRALLEDYQRIKNNGHASRNHKYILCHMEVPPKPVPKENCEMCKKRSPKVWVRCPRPIVISKDIIP